jgi:hypothetical protein
MVGKQETEGVDSIARNRKKKQKKKFSPQTCRTQRKDKNKMPATKTRNYTKQKNFELKNNREQIKTISCLWQAGIALREEQRSRREQKI